jgi:hypothetical protein
VAPGWNLLDVPLQNTSISSMSGLVASMTAAGQLGASAITAAATYANGRFAVYVPGYSADQPLSSTQGIFVNSARSGIWAPVGANYISGQALSLQPGWNLIASPYPPGGLHASVIASESTGCSVQEIAIYSGGSYQVWSPSSGTDFTVPNYGGAWIECASQGSLTPSHPQHG